METSEGTKYAALGASSADVAGLVLGTSISTSDTEHYVEGTLQAKSGSNRLGYSTDTQTYGTTTSTQSTVHCASKWEDSTVVITSVGLAFSSNDCAAGSWFELYRKREFDKTKIKLWVY